MKPPQSFFFASQTSLSDVIHLQPFQFELVSRDHERLVVGEARRHLLVVVVLQRVADARGASLRVVVRVGESAERVLQPSVSLDQEHDSSAESGNDYQRHDEHPGAARRAVADGRESVGLHFEDLRVADFREEALK